MPKVVVVRSLSAPKIVVVDPRLRGIPGSGGGGSTPLPGQQAIVAFDGPATPDFPYLHYNAADSDLTLAEGVFVLDPDHPDRVLVTEDCVVAVDGSLGAFSGPDTGLVYVYAHWEVDQVIGQNGDGAGFAHDVDFLGTRGGNPIYSPLMSRFKAGAIIQVGGGTDGPGSADLLSAGLRLICIARF